METIKLIVRNILAVIMLASLLEIILPRSEMKRYINLIIGLFIIMSILNPLFDLARKEVAFDVFDDIAAGAQIDTNALISKGKAISQAQKEMAAKNYKEKLSKQIIGLAGLYHGAQASRAEIEIVEDPAAPNFGQIKKIVLYMTPGAEQGKEQQEPPPDNSRKVNIDSHDIQVEEITVNRDNSEIKDKLDPGPGGDNSNIKNAIANFYGIDINKVEIRN